MTKFIAVSHFKTVLNCKIATLMLYLASCDVIDDVTPSKWPKSAQNRFYHNAEIECTLFYQKIRVVGAF